MIFDELKTGFRWYDSLDKQTRFKEYCQALCEYGLIAPCNDLLPFQIRVPEFGTPTEWNLVYLDGDIDITTTTYQMSATYGNPVPDWDSVLITVVSSGIVLSNTLWQGSVSSTFTLATSEITSGGTGFSGNSIGNQITIVAPNISYDSEQIRIRVYFGGAGGSSYNDYNINPVSVESVGSVLDISSCVNSLNTYHIGPYNYIQYNGGSLQGCLPQQLACGKWYSTLTDGTTVLYSEVFEVVQFEDTPFEQMKLPLFSAWRFYDDINKQTRYKEYCESACKFYLLSGSDRLLPFQIKAPDGTAGVQSWKLVGINEDCEILLDTSLVNINTTSDGDRITYNGDEVDNLSCGKYYSVLDDGVTTWYSELIEITDQVNVAESNYLLQENASKILQEDLDGILLET